MMKWTDLRLFTFREDGRNVFVAARNLEEARDVAGVKATGWTIVDCDLHITEWMFTQRQDINQGMDP